jgi:hypothetical protein
VNLEQAIFTSAQTDRADGYQIVARSPGLKEEDARELALWGPSHDSLLSLHDEAVSTNFHRMTGGTYAISRTRVAGAEYSGRGGQVFTQFLLVPPQVLARFANNPFAILRAALAAGALSGDGPPSEILEPLSLMGGCGPADLRLLAQLRRVPGPAAMATLLQAAMASDRIAVAAACPMEPLVAGLISLLPIASRIDFSFSTGLKLSPNRAVRISALPDDPLSWRAIARQGITLLDLRSTEVQERAWEGWAGEVAQILQSGKLSLLSAQLLKPRTGLKGAAASAITPAPPERCVEAACGVREVEPPASSETSSNEPSHFGSSTQRADAPHARTQPAVASGPTPASQASIDARAAISADLSPAVVELLERMDDLVFSAIGGDLRALGELEVLWPLAALELGEEAIEQTREQYLRCALSIWTQDGDGKLQRSERAVSAIDVLCVLFEN